ncbi:MAG: anti-sigma factor [Chloroflexota bacterium]
MDCEQVRDMLDAYALGASDVSEAAVVEEHVADCVRCWDELTRGQQTAALLALTVPITDAPARLEQKVLAQAQRERTYKEPHAPFWQRLRTWPAAAGALGVASVAALSVSAFLGVQVADLKDKNDGLQAQLVSNSSSFEKQLSDTKQQLADQRSIFTVLSDNDRKQVDVSAPGGTGAAAYYTWSPENDKGFMICDHLPPIAVDEVYQIWVVTAGGDSIPVTSFQSTDGTCQAPMDFAGVTISDRPVGIGITEEDLPGGSRKPTGPWLLYAHL